MATIIWCGAEVMLSPNRIRAVIFDMDGLMLDTEPIYRLAWKRAVGEVGGEFTDEHYSTFIGRSNDDCDRLMQDIYGETFPVARCRQLREHHWETHIRENGIPLKQGLHELLDFIDSLGLPKAIATASNRAEADLSIAASGIGDRFPHTTAGDEVARNKPAPDIYIESARKLGVTPVDCIVFEDSNTGAMAATAAGAVTLMVPDLQTPQPEVIARVYRVLSTLHEGRQLLADAWALGAGL